MLYEELYEKTWKLFKQTILENRWIPHQPTSKQAEFLMLSCREALYGGAAGGGKSDALLMGALQYVEIPGFNAILFRRTYKDLMLPEALMDRSLEWLGNTEAHWSGKDYIWTFPSGAKIAFGHLEAEKHKFQYQSAAFQYIGFDELTQFSESQYRYLFSRLRRLKHFHVPLRMRSGSNPGNVGHDWVKRRFNIGDTIGERVSFQGRIFIPATLNDNPHLDQETYIQSLNQLDHITRRQYKEGDWSARHGGSKFFREWFPIIDTAPVSNLTIRYWDIAATEPKQGMEPDYTAGGKCSFINGQYIIEDMKRVQRSPQNVEKLIKQTAQLDGRHVSIYMEQEPGAAGKSLIDHYARNILVGYTFRGDKVTGPKEIRANPVSSAAEAGNVLLVRGRWNSEFLDEFEAFPLGAHDDQVDVISGCFAKIAMIPQENLTIMFGKRPK
jgi:predicted phage terminase large subunit-like protein